jgi:hypothetical protein
MRVGVEGDGALELVHGGRELVRAKVRLEVREVVDRTLAMRCRNHECRVGADFACHSAPRRQPQWNLSGFRPTDRVFVSGLQFSVMQCELAYHVEEGCVGEERSSPVYAIICARGR